MPSTTSLANRLQHEYPAFVFAPSKEFRWSPTENTIFYDSISEDCASLLHEMAHAVLQHKEYTKDIRLIEMERDAWQYATDILAPKYEITVNDDAVQDALDTYRDWLHARSTCPNCKATGVQTQKSQYKCVICSAQWRVNDARLCALRRYKI